MIKSKVLMISPILILLLLLLRHLYCGNSSFSRWMLADAVVIRGDEVLVNLFTDFFSAVELLLLLFFLSTVDDIDVCDLYGGEDEEW